MALNFDDLPLATRQWLEGLRPADINDLEEALKLYKASKVLGKFWKWTFAAIVGGFIAATQLGEYIVKVWSWFKPGAH